MATREDFLVLAETLGVTLVPESLRNLRSLERSGEAGNETVVMCRDSDGNSVWLVASRRMIIEGRPPIAPHVVTDELGEVERFYASFRPKEIPSEFALWSPKSPLGSRTPWLLDV